MENFIYETPTKVYFGKDVQMVVHQFEHPERTVEKAIDLQEQYYEEIGMPTNLVSLGVKPEDLESLALGCSRNKTRKLIGDMPLGYKEILDIYNMAL